MSSIEAILAAKREEIARLESGGLAARAPRGRARRSFLGALARPGLSVIAEIKRSSPSAGSFEVDPAELARAYRGAGIDAVSILSDSHFGMTPDDFRELAAGFDIPVLRKDFILAESQVDEADRLGADAVLLIATFLSKEELDRLGRRAGALGLDVLYEVHDPGEAEKLPPGARIVGINNRDLAAADYRTDTARAARGFDRLPAGALRVAESGYGPGEPVPPGFDAVLVGAGLIRTFVQHGEEGVAGAVRDLRRNRA